MEGGHHMESRHMGLGRMHSNMIYILTLSSSLDLERLNVDLLFFDDLPTPH